MKEDNLIMKAYRDGENQNTIKIDLNPKIHGFEMYRISMVLLDKIIQSNTDIKKTRNNVENFFKKLAEDYCNFYEK